MFRQMDLKGQAQADTALKTIHQNTINTVRVYEEHNGSVQKFSSKDPFGEEILNSADTSCCSEWSGWACGHLVDLARMWRIPGTRCICSDSVEMMGRSGSNRVSQYIQISECRHNKSNAVVNWWWHFLPRIIPHSF